MEIFEILKDSIKYPFSDVKTFLIVGVLFLAVTIFQSMENFTDSSTIDFIGSTIGLLLAFVAAGYELDVLKFGIELRDDLPVLDVVRNFKNGIKLLIVDIVYYIIPIIITVLAVFLFGGILGTKLVNAGLASNATETEIMNAVLTPDLIGSVFIIFIIAAVVFILFSLLALMGQSRLAKTGSIDDAIRFGQSYEDLKEIGIGKTLALIILLYILIFVILFIFALFTAIPYIGIILMGLIGSTLVAFIQNRAYGLLYSEIA